MSIYDRYEERKGAADPTNYTFYSGTGSPDNMMPITSAEGYNLTKPFVNQTMRGVQQRVNAKASQPLALTTRSTGGGTIVDTKNALGSVASLLGPSPEERAERERGWQKNKAQMAAWTGLFDGLRGLGNLYYTSRGASPQQFSNPYTQLEHEYDLARQRENDLDAYKRAYAQQLWTMQRQQEDEARRMKLADAQVKYYGNREEMNKLKAENDRLKNEAAIKNTEARTKDVESKTKDREDLRDLNRQKKEAEIKKILHDAYKPYTNKSGGSGRSGRSGSGKGKGISDDQLKILAANLEDDPETVGPLLQEQGLGEYDASTKTFTFDKSVTKANATVVNRRAAIRKNARTNASRTSGGRTSGGRTQSTETQRIRVNW